MSTTMTEKNSTGASVDELIKSEQRKANVHFKKSNRANAIATGLLWGCAGLTLLILVYILGFILYRGFVSSNILESEYIDRGTIETSIGLYPGSSVVIANKDLRLKSIDYEDLSALLKGKPSNWGNVNEQDLKVHAYVLKSAKGDFGKKTTFLESSEEIAEAVAKQDGAFGVIPVKDAGILKDYKVNTISVEALSIGVNPTVFKIENNIKLRYIDRKMLERILKGKVTNWQEVGGIDLPLRLILPPTGSYEYHAFLDIAGVTGDKIPESAIESRTATDYYERINGYPGAIGLSLRTEGDKYGAAFLKYQYRKTKKNIALWFLFEEPKRAGKVGGVSSIIINTVYMVLLTVLFSTPIGIGAAVYLTEYARQGTLVKILRLGTETLAGIPSIIFGLFGFIVFVGYCHMGVGLLAGTLTLTLMILPTIVRTSEEAIKSVPRAVRAGSLALGAGKWQTIRKVVIPAAAPGILTGVILAIGRAVGETAALMFTMGFDYKRVKNLTSSARVLSTHLYQLVKEGISFDRAFATATILIVIVLIVNVLSTKLVKRKY
ncbi:MAG: phosphate ABC transporter permease PstA [Spirochaetales bacterium]|nr:phosphate ABC transporter permease PstA [Spirochaetales bacterium]